MKKAIVTFLLVIVFPAMASHIVGGEFELIHLTGNSYRLNLILYLDKLNGSAAAIQSDSAGVTVTIYRKRDKAFMADVNLSFNSKTAVGYAQPNCSKGEIQTDKIVLTSVITLSDIDYNDPDGYFVVWQRCCRNYQITNIFSTQPPQGATINPGTAGQTFYLEFPPVVKGGQAFINSSPRLFPPLNDYACPFRPYYVDFAGVDDDGDSLVYSLVTPWNTVNISPLPPRSPGPYPEVTWKPSFGLNNILGGAPDLRITNDGLLTCTPTDQGLYVFAVQVLQYRNKQVVGLSRRDFQMLVVDKCPRAHAPQIVGLKDGLTYQNNMSVAFADTVKDGNRCVKVMVKDPDSDSITSNFTQTVSIRATAINFNKKNLGSILPTVRSATLTHGSSSNFSICFPACPFINGPMEIAVIVQDQSCAIPLTDTLRMTVNVTPPPNTPPFFTTPNPVNASLNEGSSGGWPFEAHDNEHDSMLVYMTTDGFDLAKAGMTVNTTTNQKGKVAGLLSWDAFCNIFDFTKKSTYQVTVTVDDLDQCAFDKPVSAPYNLTVNLPGVSNPIIDTDLTADPQEVIVQGITRKIYENLQFKVTGTQAEGDFLMLKEIGAGQGVTGPTFAGARGQGSAQSSFMWEIQCNQVDLKKQDMFTFKFVAVDTANFCRFIKTDTVTVTMKVLPPDNTPPRLVIEDQQSALLPNNQLTWLVGEQVFLNIIGTDTDVDPTQDSLVLKLIHAGGNVAPKGYTFESKSGKGNVVSPFVWHPDCDIFARGQTSNDYEFEFQVTDNRCFNNKTDTVTLRLNLHDVVQYNHNFSPGNIITPNGDGCNDYFAVEGIDSSNPDCFVANTDEQVALPRDNCSGVFQFVRIHNRWGKQVFESTSRNFRWHPKDESSGEYFYLIKYTNADYKGILTVR